MKKLNFVLCAMLMSIGTLTATTYQNVLIDGIYYNLDDNYRITMDGQYVYIQYAEVTSNPNKYAGKIVIPASVEYNGITFAVKRIGNYAFQDCSNLTAVTISEGVEYIGYGAFGSCSSLTTITIPTTITEMDGSAFSGCNSLQEVKISDLKAWCKIYFRYDSSNPLTYAHHLFLNNTEVTHLVIPEGITELKQYAFYYGTGIKSISFPAGFTTIGYSALDQTGLISVKIPNSVTKIGQYAFSSCHSLESVTIPESVTFIESYAFQHCEKLQSIILPSSITNISAYLFYNCAGLKSVTIPNTVEGIGSSAFGYCTGLSSIVLPESVTSIGSQAFRYSGLTSIELPNSLENIANEVFLNCNQLTSVTIGTHVANIHSTAFNNCSKLNSIVWNATDFADFGSASLSPFYTYRNNIKSFTFGENVQHIPAFMCYEMSNLSRIDIPASVTSVGEGAFAYCGRLTEINATAGSPLYSSEEGVLFSKDKTSLIIYPAGKSATSYIVPSIVQTIEENAFYGCANLSSITIPASVKSIGAGNGTISMWSFNGSVPPTIPNDAFPNDVYIIVDNAETYKAAWPQYASRIFPRQYAEQTVTITAQSDKSALHVALGEENLANVLKLTISGSINSYDLMIMRNKMINLSELDLTNASIVANTYGYYTGICSHADTLLAHSFRGLRSVKLPRTLKYVEQAMIDCPDIKYIEFNGGVVGTQVAPYEGNADLKVVMNEGVTEIKPYAFVDNNTIHCSASYNVANTKLRELVLPSSLDSIAEKRFWYCTKLQSVQLGEKIKSVGDYAFCECFALTEIELPDDLRTIGDFAFQGAGLKHITIPNKVTSIGNGAFMGAFGGRWNTASQYNNLGKSLWILYRSETDNYIYGVGINPVTNTMKPFYLGLNAFRNGGVSGHGYTTTPTDLANIHFAPNSQLKEIGMFAFPYCQLDSVTIPASVTTIGKFAFIGNQKMSYLAFEENSAVRTIEEGTFQNCGGLQRVILPEGLIKLDELAFSLHSGDDNLKHIVLPPNIVTIADGAFYGRKGLEKIDIPTSAQTIGQYAFQNCSSLVEVKVPSSLLSIGNYAFAGCDDVTKVYTYTVEPVAINQNTFSCWRNADLYVPSTSYNNYFYNTQWSQFLSLKQFDEEYSYFYINNDYELGGETGTIDGKPDADLNENSGLIITGDDLQEVGVITIAGDDNGAASIIACEGNLKADELVIQLITKKGNWSYFCFPFDVLLDQLSYAHQYVFKQYDGATRAQYGAGGWVKMAGDVLQKGLGYIFQGAKTDTLKIRIPNPKIGCKDYKQLIRAFGAEQAIHANWNFIGNPYPSWYDLDELFYGGFSSPVYIWDAGLSDYKVYRPGDDDYHFHPYEGFFTQNPNGQDMTIVWGSNGRETKSQADIKQHGNHAPRQHARRVRQQQDKRQLIDIRLASADYADRARVVFNAEASLGYELGRDAVMMEGGQAPLHIWSIAPDNSRLAINERPYATGEVALGYDVNEDGYYTLSAARMDKDVILYDNELQQEVDLSMGDYTFYTEAGENNTRFGVRRIKGQEEVYTDISAQDADEMVNVYTLLGVKLMNNVRRADLRLDAGVYLIEHTDGSRSEITIQR